MAAPQPEKMGGLEITTHEIDDTCDAEAISRPLTLFDEGQPKGVEKRRTLSRWVRSTIALHSPLTRNGRLRIKSTFLASGPAAARFPEPCPPKKQADRRGWRFGSLLARCAVGSCLGINILFLILACSLSHVSDGTGILFEGDCGKVRTFDTWVHVVINGLATALVGASNYTMQCLAAPCRSEVDAAHAKGVWLDIGVPSVRNLRHIARSRVALWFALAVSTVPIHLMWNSVIFSSLQKNSFVVVGASASILQDNSFNCTDAAFNYTALGGSSPDYSDYSDIVCNMYDYARAPPEAGSPLTRLEAKDCLQQYSADIQSQWSNVVVVFDDEDVDAGCGHEPLPANATQLFGFLAQAKFLQNEGYCYNQSTGALDAADRSYITFLEEQDIFVMPATSDHVVQAPRYPIDYCLAMEGSKSCRLQFSLPILLIVIVCNAVKLSAIVWTLKVMKREHFMTLGDSIASFLEVPDKTTVGHCLKAKSFFQRKRSQLGEVDLLSRVYSTRNAKTVKPTRLFWFRAPSLKRWFFLLALCLATLACCGVLLSMAIEHEQTQSTNGIWSIGFGTVNANAILHYEGTDLSGSSNPSSTTLLPMVLLANSPQLLLSILYFLYNSMYTCMLAASEWSRFAVQRKGLRVSSPRGSQRSTYWLQLPWLYSLPLSVAAAILHWLVSQSIFLVKIDAYDPRQHLDLWNSFSSCGYSAYALVITIIVGSVMVLTVVANGFRRLDTTMPLAGSCSLAISAACHRPLDDDEASLFPVRWGALSHDTEEEGVGHCCFTSFDVEAPVEGRRYH